MLRTQNKEIFVHGNSNGEMCLVNTTILQWMAELSILCSKPFRLLLAQSHMPYIEDPDI